MASTKWIPQRTQIDMMEAATQPTHLVRVCDAKELIKEAISAITLEADLVLDTVFAGAYDSATQTLTASAVGITEVDGIAVSSGDTILITAQSTASENGLYEVTVAGTASVATILTRSDNFNASEKINQGIMIEVSGGTTYSNSKWKTIITDIPFILDTSDINFDRVVEQPRTVSMDFQIVGNDSDLEFTFTHGLNTRSIIKSIVNNNTGIVEEMGVEYPTVNTVNVFVGNPLGVGNDFTLTLITVVAPL